MAARRFLHFINVLNFNVLHFAVLYLVPTVCSYIKTIIHLGLTEYRWIKNSTSSRIIFADIHFAFGEYFLNELYGICLEKKLVVFAC